MKPKVINIKDAPRDWRANPDYVYIGRGGGWGNPFIRGKKCQDCGEVHSEPGSTLPCYEKWLRTCVLPSPSFAAAIKMLWGKTLVCFCKPNPCHGDILAQVCEELNSRKVVVWPDLTWVDYDDFDYEKDWKWKSDDYTEILVPGDLHDEDVERWLSDHAKKEGDHSSYITVVEGSGGWFVVQVWWNPELGGFWEPFQTGIGRYIDKKDAEVEAKDWAEAEDMPYKEAN